MRHKGGVAVVDPGRALGLMQNPLATHTSFGVAWNGDNLCHSPMSLHFYVPNYGSPINGCSIECAMRCVWE